MDAAAEVMAVGMGWKERAKRMLGVWLMDWKVLFKRSKMVERRGAEGAWVRVRKSQLCLKDDKFFSRLGMEGGVGGYRWPGAAS